MWNRIRKKESFGAVLFIAFIICIAPVSAQESVNASGGNASGSGGSVSYSVGQLVFTTSTGTTGSVEQGVQHPYEIMMVTGTEEAKGILLSVSAYPNPAANYLTLEIHDCEISNLSFQIYDMQGNLVCNDNIEGMRSGIYTGNLAPAAYFLKVTRGKEILKTFKIIKK